MGENEIVDEKERQRKAEEEFFQRSAERIRKKIERSDQFRAANKKRHAELRTANRKKSIEIAKTLLSELRRKIGECIWPQAKIADYSGIAPTTLTKIKRGYYKTARFSTMVALARALGYKFILVPMDASEDDFYDERWVRKSSTRPK